jgi:AraC-like DNA-binding protein
VIRRSSATNAAAATAHATNDGHVHAGQPASGPKVNGRTNASRTTARSAAPAGSSRRGDAPRHRRQATPCPRQQERSDGHVEQERRPPGRGHQLGLDQQPADDLARGDAGGEDHRVGADGAGSRLAVELQADDRQHLRGHHRARCTLQAAGRDQHGRCGRQPTRERAHREPGQPGQEGPPMAGDVAEPRAGHHERGERQRVHGNDQLELGVRGVQVSPEAGCGDDEDGGVHRGHGLPDEQEHQHVHGRQRAIRRALRAWIFVPGCQTGLMLARRRLLDHDGITIDDVACRHRAGRGRDVELSDGFGIVFVRRGCFVRSADGAEAVLDPTVAYCVNPAQELRFDHPAGGGDDCTAVGLDPAVAASLWGDDRPLPVGPLPTPPAIDLGPRRLLAASRRGAPADELAERALNLAAATLAPAGQRRAAARHPAADRARRALVDDAREALAADPGRRLPELARDLAVSPHHLSRVFRAVTGETVSRHRMRLRARGALERLARGEASLARLAADLGFADQSHLCRVVRQETGELPSALRRQLAGT